MPSDKQLPETVQIPAKKGQPRKPYHKPQLAALGDLRSLTLGGSFGTGESGSMVRKVKMGLPQHDGFTLPDGSTLLPDGRIIPPGGNP